MGYNTNFSLMVLSAPGSDPISKNTYKQLEESIDKIIHFDCGSIQNMLRVKATWYDYEEDMLDLSAQFPDVLFALYGAGDDREDLWRAYFLDGKVQQCPATITFDDFDPAKMVSRMEEVTTCL